VWEPNLAGIINSCGLKYTFLDDTHFRYAGCNKEEFFGYYTTEDQAKPISVFPISKSLRYKIPFSQASEAIDLLNSFKKEGDVLVTLFDDGEKFGMWPHTFDWVYEKGWLHKFFSLLRESTSIETITPAKALEKFSSRGLIYLPTASYEEMGEWVLEPGDFSVFEDLNNFLKSHHKYHKFKDFVRGGFFRNFYKKYNRLNYMHKRMLSVSEKINKHTDFNKDKDMFLNLWKAQTNCGYWHGVFGGFYLGHIRASIYEKLITAENLFDKKFTKSEICVERRDFDFDGVEEVLLKNRKIICCFSCRGGSLAELSLRKPALNLVNTITRRVESYHRKITDKVAHKGCVSTIHDIVTSKEDNLRRFLSYDKYERLCLLDHLLSKDLTVEDLVGQKGISTFSNSLYDLNVRKSKKEIILDWSYQDQTIDFSKIVKFSSRCGFDAEYKFFGKNEKKGLNNHNFGIEFNLALESPKDIFKKEKNGQTSLMAPTVTKDISSFEIDDHYKDITLNFKFDKADIYTAPLYSVSSSESGFEKVYQQIIVLFIIKDIKRGVKLSFVVG
ncbi:MAG: alpha-amylase/4-alpha-glucanotransferase domain-containing protein, partial [Candidatus Omnitrophota bacterium]